LIPLFSGLTRLAGSIIDAWATLEKRSEGQLDREHQRQLQRAQHDHEKLLRRGKDSLASTESFVPNLSETYLERLRIEAILLSAMGYEVLYEPIGKGYGLAIPISDHLILAFWLSISYPDQAPDIYMKTQLEIDKIEFEGNAWEENHSIAEIVSAITLEESNEDEEA
jgi:hypothetical protein